MTQTMVIDFRKVKDPPKFKSGREKSLTPKQLRARARRKIEKGKRPDEELQLLYKPIEEWDIEELAKGRPRAKDGSFSGRPPTWLNRQVYEEAVGRFGQVVREGVHANAATALGIITQLLESDDLDDKGKPLVPASVKLDASKWLIEHVIGKPTQRVEQDISVKLQAVLAQVMITPSSPAAFTMPVTPVLAPASDTGDIWDAEVLDEDD